MNDICVHMIVRDGEFAELCLRAVLPHVKKGMVLIDGRSSDEFKNKIYELRGEYRNLDVDTFRVEKPKDDLVRMRNVLLSLTEEKWIWLVDDDEFYPIEIILEFIPQIQDAYDSYAFRCWAVWNKYSAHKQTSGRIVPRIFKNKEGLEWGKKFGSETLFENGKRMWHKKPWKERNAFVFPHRYIHLTHIKKQSWREELGMERTVDGKHLIPLPDEVKKLVENIYAQRG